MRFVEHELTKEVCLLLCRKYVTLPHFRNISTKHVKVNFFVTENLVLEKRKEAQMEVKFLSN